jgi:hypothetical protein
MFQYKYLYIFQPYPSKRQTAELKTQFANLTNVPEDNMYGYKLTKNSGFAPTPAPTNVPTPLPTPVPTGVCGCPRAYYIYIGVTVTTQRLCSVFSPNVATGSNYECCLYCCHRTASVCNTNFGNTSLYDLDTRRNLMEDSMEEVSEQWTETQSQEEEEEEGEEGRFEEETVVNSGHRGLRAVPNQDRGPEHRELLSFYWDVNYRVIASAADLGYDTITSTELATEIYNDIYGVGLHYFKVTNCTSIYPEK